MTTLKVNVIRKPTIKVKVLPRFPSEVFALSPILLSKIGGNYTFSFDVAALGSSITIDAGNIISGTLPIARMPALTGDVTTVVGNVATTLATVNANVGTFGSATQAITATFNAKGLLTAVANVTITPAIGSVTGLGTGVATFLATPSSANLRAALTDEVGTGAAYFVGGALGTPASGTATNLTGLPLSGLTTQAAFTFVGNNTSGAAVPTAVDIAALTTKASPAAGDFVIISDQAASGAWKKAALSTVGGVVSVNGQTGALAIFTPPQGRLTLTTGVARPTADVSGATTVFYTPATGFQVPIYDGTNFVPTAFTQLSQVTTDATKSPAAVTTNSNYDVFVWNDSGTVRATRGPPWTSDTARGTGAGTTELVIVTGVQLNANAITNGPAAQRGTYVGTIRSNGTSTIDFTFGSTAAGGGPAVFGVWNAYNQILFNAIVGEGTASWTYTSATVRAMQGSNGNRVSFVSGLKIMPIAVNRGYWADTAAVIGAAFFPGFALNATNVNDKRATIYSPTAAVFIAQSTLSGTYAPQLGFGFIQATEAGDGANSTLLQGANASSLFEVMAWQ